MSPLSTRPRGPLRQRARRALVAALPLALSALVVLLAALQYRWLGQVSEIERQEMRASLLRRGQDFANEFDREVGALYTALAAVATSDDDEIPSTVAGTLRSWRTQARFAGMAEALYLSSTSDPHDQIRRINIDTGSVQAVPVPVQLRPAVPAIGLTRGRAEERVGGRGFVQFVALGGAPIVSRVPALVIWLPSRTPLEATAPSSPLLAPFVDVMFRGPVSQQAIIVELDREYLHETVLPALLNRHFGGGGSEARMQKELIDRLSVSSQARLEIVDAGDRSILQRGVPAGGSIPADQADVVVPFFMPHAEREATPGVRVTKWAETLRSDRPQANAAVRVEMRATTDKDVVAGREFFNLAVESWHLRLQHAAGSLDRAVAIGRRRNLALSFGILTLLGAAMALVIVNARRSERLAAQQMHFVAAVSHELRTPLAVIRSAAENISAGIVKDSDQAERYGRLIESEGRRLTSMVEQVLAHAGIGAISSRRVQTRPVEVGRAIADAVAGTTTLAAQAGCEVEVDVEPGMPAAKADEIALRSAVENLVTNAIKHAAVGRLVRITARTAPELPAGAARSDRSTLIGPAIEISVTDKGPGIDPKDRSHVFEPFYRGQRAIDEQIPGTGLGLSLVKQSVEDMGGRIAVQAAAGGGSRFSLLLPSAASSDISDVSPHS